MTEISVSEALKLFHQGFRFLDVRAPIEWEQGIMLEALNVPLLDNAMRSHIGTVYKAQGKDSAVALGYSYYPEKKQIEWAKSIPDEIHALFCFRGGMRSGISQSWLRTHFNRDIPRVTGGYKALRNYYLSQLPLLLSQVKFILVSGLTGSGKTELLRKSGIPFLDLEQLACHRGSAFGKIHNTNLSIPSQSTFENKIFETLDKLIRFQGHRYILLENESRFIGPSMIPVALYEKMQHSPLVKLIECKERRIQRIFKEYFDYEDFDKNQFSTNLQKISKKLGGVRYQECLQLLQDTQYYQLIEKLLDYYYDPSYKRLESIHESNQRFVFTGNDAECLIYLKQLPIL